MVALGRVVLSTREHVIALEARDKGILGMLLHYPYEVRKPEEYFDDIPDEKAPKEMLDLAVHIIDTMAGHFDPEKFDDRYEDVRMRSATSSNARPLARRSLLRSIPDRRRPRT
jgi:DNA end-binding protein Ku